MRAEVAAVFLLALSGCELKDSARSADPNAPRWVAAGLGRCTALTPTDRQTVIAACEQGAVEVGADGRVVTLHDSMVDHVAVDKKSLWVKLPDQLLRGPLPQPGRSFTPRKSLELGTVDDLLVVPGSPLIVATPGTLVHVSAGATASRWRKVPVPMHQLAAGPDGEIFAVSHDAVYAVEKRQFRQVIGGLDDVAAAVSLASGKLVVASGQPARLGTVTDQGYAPSKVEIEGLTDLVVMSNEDGPALWFTTSDGSVGYTAIP